MARFQLQRRLDVGFIALAGVAAETGVTILIYLDPSACGREGSGRRAKTACSGAPIYTRRSWKAPSSRPFPR
jgi:hypothetical protein